jgi:integral membrane protein (TIGR01906 family)
MFKKYYLLIPLFFLLISVNIVVFDSDFYLSAESEVDYYQEEVGNLLDYFKGGELNGERYSAEEIIHLDDVRDLIWLSLALVLILFLLLSYFEGTFSWMKRANFFIYGGILNSVSLLVIGIVLLGFNFFFRIFHEVLFRNDYWLLPSDSTLIQMFPESFFVGAVVRILLYMGIFSISFVVIGMFFRWKNGKS